MCQPDKTDKDLKYCQILKEKYENEPTVHSLFDSTPPSNDDGLILQIPDIIEE